MKRNRIYDWSTPLIHVQNLDARHQTQRISIEDSDENDLSKSYGLKLWFHYTLEGLAKLDAKLVETDMFLLSTDNQSESLKDAQNEQITLSGLWVMGAYEFLRVFSDRIHENRHPQRNEFTKLLQEFGSVRVPLAKLEPQGKSIKKKCEANPAANAKGYFIARPGWSDQGTGWIVAKEKFVSRLSLANKLITGLTHYNHWKNISAANLLPFRPMELALPQRLVEGPWPRREPE